MTDKKTKSLHFVSGLALGGAVAAGAAFLYKTKKGKKFRRQFKGHIDDAQAYLSELVKDVKLQAKKIEAQLDTVNQHQQTQTKKIRQKTSSQLKQAADIIKKRVFVKSGKPLAK